MKSTTATPKK